MAMKRVNYTPSFGKVEEEEDDDEDDDDDEPIRLVTRGGKTIKR